MNLTCLTNSHLLLTPASKKKPHASPIPPHQGRKKQKTNQNNNQKTQAPCQKRNDTKLSDSPSPTRENATVPTAAQTEHHPLPEPVLPSVFLLNKVVDEEGADNKALLCTSEVEQWRCQMHHSLLFCDKNTTTEGNEQTCCAKDIDAELASYWKRAASDTGSLPNLCCFRKMQNSRKGIIFRLVKSLDSGTGRGSLVELLSPKWTIVVRDLPKDNPRGHLVQGLQRELWQFLALTLVPKQAIHRHLNLVICRRQR